MRSALAVLAIALAAASACGRGDEAGADLERRAASTTSSTAAPTTTSSTIVTTTTAPTTTTTAPAVVASDPAGLAAQIVAAERTIRDPVTPPEAVAPAARIQQLAYRLLGQHPEWDAAVAAAVPADLQDVVARNVAARRDFRSMHTTLQDTLPAWRIEAPRPADELLGYYQEAEARFGVPWHVLAAVNLVETGMGRIVGLSTAGAQGPMQFLPSTWAAYGMGGDVWNPRDAILGAANYLAANGAAGGDLEHALYRYNNHDAYVRGVVHYSALMAADARAYYGYHAWEVVYLTTMGDVILPVGFESADRIPVADWLASHSQ